VGDGFILRGRTPRFFLDGSTSGPGVDGCAGIEPAANGRADFLAFLTADGTADDAA
jgi:hypothetical protein